MPTDSQLDQVFFALSDSTRRAILARLSQGSTTIGELSQPFAMSKPAISKHMKILERAGLIDRNINGRTHRCSLATNSLITAEQWISFQRKFWESRFDALDNLLADQKTENEE